MQFLARIRQSTDAVINITTSGSSLMALDERLAAPLRAEPEMCSLNMGSMTFALFPALDREREWKHAWESDLLEATRSTIFKNTFADMESIIARLGDGCGTRFEFECYDVGHIYTLAHLRPGAGVRSAIRPIRVGRAGRNRPRCRQPHPHEAHRRQALGDDYRFSVLAAGRHQMPLLSIAAAMGGNVRLGLEDSLYDRRELARPNADQVRHPHSEPSLRICAIISHAPANCQSPPSFRDASSAADLTRRAIGSSFVRSTDAVAPNELIVRIASPSSLKIGEDRPNMPAAKSP